MSVCTVEPIYSQFRDDPDFQGLIQDFVVSLHERREVLEGLFAAGSIAEIGRLAHQIKGAGGGYGFSPLSQLAARLEVACRSPEPHLGLIGPLVEELLDHLRRVSV